MEKEHITVNIEQEIAVEAERIFVDMGLDLSMAIHLFLHQVIRERAIPFRIGEPDPNMDGFELLQAYVEAEREDSRKRQAEGIAAAKARGVKFGRPTKKQREEPQFEILRRQYLEGNITGEEAAKELGIHRKTFFRWIESESHEKDLKGDEKK